MVHNSINCRRCGRKLTDPESIAKGIGPVCEGKEELELKGVKREREQGVEEG